MTCSSWRAAPRTTSSGKSRPQQSSRVTLAIVSVPFGWDFPYAWPRTPILGANAVCTSQPLAAQAGLRMLADGGNAVDAAIATAITLTVVEPVSNGIGSDAFAIVWDGQKLHGLNASGRSPAAWTPEYFGGEGRSGTRLEFGDGARRGVGLDGAARQVRQTAVREALRARHLLWTQRFSGLADRRVAVGARRSRCSRPNPGSPRRSCPAGARQGPVSCSRFADHAATLEKIAATNGEAFYRGELAEQLEAHATANGGAMRASDLAAHRADWVGTISADLPRLHRPRDSAQRPGHRGADRSGNPRAVRHVLAGQSIPPTACICRSKRSSSPSPTRRPMSPTSTTCR